jgi:hypothetical protein
VGVVTLSSRSRVLIISMTQSGKTTMSAAMSNVIMAAASSAKRQRQAVVIVDSKREPALAKLVPTESKSLPTDKGGWYRFCPLSFDDHEALLAQVFDRGDVWLWLDELPLVGDAVKYPESLDHIYRQGKVRNVGVLALAQDPKRIPMVAKSQSEIFLIGRIGAPDYIDACADMIHQPRGELASRIARMPKYSFLLWSWDHGTEGRPPDLVSL